MEIVLVIASRKSRVIAYFLDFSIFLTTIFIISMVLILMSFDEIENIGLPLIFFSIGMFLFLILFIFKDIYKGKSLGKWLLGISVREEGNINNVPSISKLFLRNLTLVLGFIEFLVLAVDQDKQRIGDKLAHTVVVKTKEMTVLKKIVVILSLFFLFIVLNIALFASIYLSFMNSDSYQVSEEYILNDSTVISETGGIEGFGYFPAASVNIANGHGEAFYTIKVKGKERDVYVDVSLAKEPKGKWYIQKSECYE